MKDHPDNANLPHINRPETLLGITVSFLILSCIGVFLRLFVRLKERIYGYDDLFVLLALVSTAIGSIITCLMPDNGMGKHFWTLKEHMIIEYFKHVWSSNVTYSAATTFIKLSILYQYLRFFDFQSKVARIMTWCLFVFIAMWGMTFFLLALFSCRPIRKNWDWLVPGTCVAWGSKDPDVFFATWASHSATNMLLDILVLVLPIPFLRDLRIQGKSRLGLIGLFTVGGVVVSMSIARMVALSINRAGTVPILDMTYATPAIYIFSILEVNIAILCASIPIFWPLVTAIAANKILVVNEVEIRSDRRDSSHLGFTDRSGFTGLPEIELHDDIDSKPKSRLSVLVSSKETNFTTMPAKAATRLHSHNSKPSNSSYRNEPSIDISRTSQESQLNLAHQRSNGTLSAASAYSNSDPKLSLDNSRHGSTGHYHDRYVQEWAVPGFDKEIEGTSGSTGIKTTVSGAPLSYDHLSRTSREKMRP